MNFRRKIINLLEGNPRLRRYKELMSKGVNLLASEGPVALFRKIYTFSVFKLKQLSLAARYRKIPRIEDLDGSLFRSLYSEYLDTARGGRDAKYVSFTETNLDPSDFSVKLVAFYLPQYHPIPENDMWWGKGFTEWTNVSKAVPQFAGHYQPHLPGELGFYDLRVPEILERQVELARNYGIYGFCFHYYWFNGKRLLEKPLDLFLKNPKIDFPFCLCWANENWTRRWDGYESEVLIAQEHTEESDIAFIRDIAPILNHKNYIKINGRPLLIVYRVQLMPDPETAGKVWKEYCKENGIGEPYLVAAQTFGFYNPDEVGFDAAVEFPPHNILLENISPEVKLLNPDFTGLVYRYDDLVRKMNDLAYKAQFKLFKAVSPAWDNEPRKPGRGHIFAFSSPEKYQDWLSDACKFALMDPDPQGRLVFINAWNEWGEGTYLEPDRKYGYANLQATLDALKGVSAKKQEIKADKWTILFVSHDADVRGGAQALLLKIIAWFKNHTQIQIKILCLEGGGLLPAFQRLGDTIEFNQLNANSPNGETINDNLVGFCGSRPDLIYLNTVASGRILRELERLGSPILIHIHELEMSITRYAKDWIDDIRKYPDRFIAVSNAVRENLISAHNIDPDLVTTVYGGINADSSYKPLSKQERKKSRLSLGLDQDKLLVFGCGVGMPFRKGADLFIETAKLLREKYGNVLHFYWIGGFEPYESDPRFGFWKDHLDAIRTEGLGDFVTFLGYKENPEDYLQVGDIFILPSREDPFPLVVMEAAKFELPILTFDKGGGSPEFVGANTGFIVPFENTKSLAEAIIILVKDPDLRLAFGQQARAKLLNRFTIDKIAPHILQTCRKVANKQPVVSIIIPNYNHAKYLPDRLESILNQSYRDFEVIILDDASSDTSMEVIEKYAENADVRIIRNSTNSGSPFKQWLKGLNFARADLIWIAESDDSCDPRFLETLIPVMNDPDIRLAYADSHIINEKGEVTGDYLKSEYLLSLSQSKWNESYDIPAAQEINDGLGVKNTILNISAAIFRKFDFTLEFKRTLEDMRIAGDWYFIVNAILGGTLHFEAKKLNYHRRHSESVIGKIISEKHVKDFFSEFYIVQDWIANNYTLQDDFEYKWETYLRQQWKDFCPGKEFSALRDYYPFDEMKKRINRRQETDEVKTT